MTASSAASPRRTASPYSTGGGGTVLEHQYGALVLSHILTSDPLPELGDDVAPTEVAFQASTMSPVDDLLVTGIQADGKRRQVSIGVRRDPSFTKSSIETIELVKTYLQLIAENLEEIELGYWRIALIVANSNIHVKELKELASIARATTTKEEFENEVQTEGRTRTAVRNRLAQLEQVVVAAANALDPKPDPILAESFTWVLLRKLYLREVRLEGVDKSDRTQAVARLRAVVSDGSSAAAHRLHSRLCELMGEYAPTAARRTDTTLRQDLVGYSLADNTSAEEESLSESMSDSRSIVQSNYLIQVDRIAPETLLERETELMFMEDYCRASNVPSYLYWVAPAWAGKSALLSSFVLNPPEGVQLLSFFATARWSSQADIKAFIEVVLEQALDLLGEPMPTLLTDATREAHLLAAFGRASELCRRRGKRLVLVVDGLDEDRGVTTGADSHSIAAFLPVRPPANMRIIASGRPNPPIPSDVPEDHPLRSSEIVYSLATSAHAEVVRNDAERELKRLLAGDTIERDLLGLIVAAGGGLSSLDLAELTNSAEWEIEDQLKSGSSRTFSSRSGLWHSKTRYILSHEEIQLQASRMLGESRLTEYRSIIYRWAKSYQDRGWPSHTPEYLMRGYFELLRSQSELTTMFEMAVDSRRHNRMLDTIGGDNYALGEIETVQDLMLRQTDVDLRELVRLSVHRAKLSERNAHIPSHLPVAWAQLGRIGRAEALARSMSTPFLQGRSLTAIARQAAEDGLLEEALRICTQSDRIIEHVTDIGERSSLYGLSARSLAIAGNRPQALQKISASKTLIASMPANPKKWHALQTVARASAAAKEVEDAVILAKSISNRFDRDQALCGVAIEVALSGDWRRAYKIARSIRGRGERANALAVTSRIAATAGERDSSLRIASEAIGIATNTKNPARRAWLTAIISYERSLAGDRRNSSRMLRASQQAMNLLNQEKDLNQCSAALSRALVKAGNEQEAIKIARRLKSPLRQNQVLSVIASQLASEGKTQAAETLAAEVEAAVRATGHEKLMDKNLSALAQAISTIRDLSLAETIAERIQDLYRRDRALTSLAESAASSGNLSEATRISHRISSTEQRSRALMQIVKSSWGKQDPSQLRSIADSIESPAYKRRTWKWIKQDSILLNPVLHDPANASNPPGTQAALDSPQVLEVKVSSSGSGEQDVFRSAQRLSKLAVQLVSEGDLDGALLIVREIPPASLKLDAMLAIHSLLRDGNHDQDANAVLNLCLELCQEISSQSTRDQSYLKMASQLASFLELDRAEQIAYEIANLSVRQKALCRIGIISSQNGSLNESIRISSSVLDTKLRERAFTEIVSHAVDLGRLNESRQVAYKISDPVRRSTALGIVAIAYANISDFELAEQVTLEIPDSDVQCRTLAALSLKSGSTAFQSFLAQALVVGHWRNSLHALAGLEPDCVRLIASEYLAINTL
jgi:hypothetical protein